MALLGGVEAGGTKFVCAVGSGPEDIRSLVRIPTTTPEETLAQVVDFFQEQMEQEGALEAIGIGAFGPVDVRKSSPTFGWFLVRQNQTGSRWILLGLLIASLAFRLVLTPM